MGSTGPRSSFEDLRHGDFFQTFFNKVRFSKNVTEIYQVQYRKCTEKAVKGFSASTKKLFLTHPVSHP